MATSLSNKVALVTGASKGIGAGISRHLAEAGAAVVVNYASDKTGAEAVVFLASSASDWLTGENLNATGGVR
jgi:3-oxoacyl-[acyl-carrier protein] reductase